MLALPISLVVALALGFLLIRTLIAKPHSWPIPLLLAASAAQGVINALAQYYGLNAVRLAQPVTAAMIPPLAWLALQATLVRPFEPSRDLVHLAVPVFVAFCALVAPDTLDFAVPAVFALYALAMVLAVRGGADGLPMSPLGDGEWPPWAWRGVAAALALSAVSDLLIFAAHVFRADWMKPWLISLVSSLSLLLLGALALAGGTQADAELTPEPERPDAAVPVDAARDAAILNQLDTLLVEQRLFLDPDLTLSRLARRLGLPAKQVSGAINRPTGENVSRYVNAHRIRHACALLRAGSGVTTAMLESGFNTKSNFNREFQRVAGVSPTQWRALAPPPLPPP
ncbi:MAG TPA: AraC family transcriptional regulator [Xanthobacteraceae bacterium]|nr:AraC family transcriptional regulator [Xanthobacteraceae bacterium]